MFSKIPADIGPFLGIVLGLALVAHLANRWLVPDANAVVLPLAALLNGIGYVVIARWNPPIAREQAAWTALGVGLYVLTLLVVRHSRDLERYRYLLLLLAGVLLVAPLFFSPINGAHLWVHFGGLAFQPIEFSKILLVIYFASYFAANKELLSIPTARLGNRLVLDPRPLLPLLVAWGAALAVIGVEGDVGFAALLFTVFIAMLWLTTGRFGYLVFGVVLFAAGAYVAARYFGQVHLRVEAWLNPWSTPTNPNLNGGQLRLGWYGFGSGGVGGTGLGFDTAAGNIPELTTDMIFAAIGIEMGLVGRGRRRLRLHPARRLGHAHRPGGAVGLPPAHGGRVHAHPRLPGLLHHGGSDPVAAVHRHHTALRRLRRVLPARELRPHRAPVAHLPRGCTDPGRHAGRRACRRAGRRADGAGAIAVAVPVDRRRQGLATADISSGPRVASADPTRMSGKPTAMPAVNGSPRSVTPRSTATAGLT